MIKFNYQQLSVIEADELVAIEGKEIEKEYDACGIVNATKGCKVNGSQSCRTPGSIYIARANFSFIETNPNLRIDGNKSMSAPSWSACAS